MNGRRRSSARATARRCRSSDVPRARRFDEFRGALLERASPTGAASPRSSPRREPASRVGALRRRSPTTARAASRVAARGSTDDRFPSLTPELPAGPPLRARDRRAVRRRARRATPGSSRSASTARWRPGRDAWGRPAGDPIVGVTDFFRVEGDEVHEVAVGPVHAGVIEPGHFRFQCHGEHVFHLEISLGYQHRGVERALVGGPTKRTDPLHGDARRRHDDRPRDRLLPGRRGAWRARASRRARRRSAASPWSWSGWPTTPATSARWPATSASCPTASYCGRLRGDFLNLTALLCGSRFGRGLVRPGGVALRPRRRPIAASCLRAPRGRRDATSRSAVDLLWDTPSVMARFEETGRVARGDAPRRSASSARPRAPAGSTATCGTTIPSGIYRFAHVPVVDLAHAATSSPAPTSAGSRSSAPSTFIARRSSTRFPAAPVRASRGRSRPDHVAVSLVEGWRGEICHVALTDADGPLRALQDRRSRRSTTGSAWRWRCASQQISDFPLCNKSFNLSYCGHDL